MNPIIFLWAHPCSMSTAIERVMRERGDLDCVHEPFLHYYYHRRSRRSLPHFSSDEQWPSSYAGVRDLILERAERAPVFATDMSYYVMPELIDDSRFCRRIRHCFLIRNPLHSILSYYRLDPGVTLREIGLEAQWQQHCLLRDSGIAPVPVIEAEAVQADAAGMMRRLCAELDLDFREQALHWAPGEVPQDWEHVEGWHRSVGESSGIRAPRADEAARIRQDFDKLCVRAPQLRDYLEHHLPFYRQLQQYSLQPRAHVLPL